jgi:hypothetical protein
VLFRLRERLTGQAKFLGDWLLEAGGRAHRHWRKLERPSEEGQQRLLDLHGFQEGLVSLREEGRLGRLLGRLIQTARAQEQAAARAATKEVTLRFQKWITSSMEKGGRQAHQWAKRQYQEEEEQWQPTGDLMDRIEATASMWEELWHKGRGYQGRIERRPGQLDWMKELESAAREEATELDTISPNQVRGVIKAAQRKQAGAWITGWWQTGRVWTARHSRN